MTIQRTELINLRPYIPGMCDTGMDGHGKCSHKFYMFAGLLQQLFVDVLAVAIICACQKYGQGGTTVNYVKFWNPKGGRRMMPRVVP